MLQGLRTAIYRVEDLGKARDWYTKVLGFRPYFDQPFYVGFEVGGYELGLHPTDGKPHPGEGGVAVYWGTANARAERARLLELGAKPHEDVRDVGEGILVASVRDPFGNVFGIIQNPHFKIPKA